MQTETLAIRTGGATLPRHGRLRPRGGAPRRGLGLLVALAMLRCSGTEEPPPRSAQHEAPAVAVLAISPSNPQLAQGSVQPFTARGLLVNGDSQEVTAQTRWTVRDESGNLVAQPGAGLLPFARPGRYLVTAEHAGRSVSTPVTVTAATVSSLSVAPTTPSVPKGLTKQFKATARFSDGTTQDVSAAATWSVKDTTGSGVALVSSLGLVTAAAVGKARVQASYLGKTSYTTLTVTPAVVVRLAVAPADPIIGKGTSQIFTAQGTYSDGSVEDVSALAAWSVADLAGSGVAAVSSSGTAFGSAPGKARISAELDGQQADTTLTVLPAAVSAIVLSPASASLAKGLTQQVTAQARLADGSALDVTRLAAWSATDVSGTAVAAIDSTGLASANGIGKARIDCTYAGKSASMSLEVKAARLATLELVPSSLTLPKGLTGTLVARGTFTDGTVRSVSGDVTWTAVDVTGTDVVSIATDKTLRARSLGRARIDVTSGTVSASAAVEVTAPVASFITVGPRPVSISRGDKQSFTATATMSDGTQLDVTAAATWSVTDLAGSGVASIDRTGTLIGNAEGRAQVEASYLTLTDTSEVGVDAWITLFIAGRLENRPILWGARDDDAWLGLTSEARHWDGKRFTRQTVAQGPVRGIWGTGPSDVWFYSGNLILSHWNGTRCTPALLRTELTSGAGLWGSRSDDVWFTTQTGLLHWNGSAFPFTSITAPVPGQVWGSSATDVWVVGRGAGASRFDGTTWSVSALPAPPDSNFTVLRGSSGSDLWASDSAHGLLLHYDGSLWQAVARPDPGSQIFGLVVRSPTEAWAAGAGGLLLRWDGTSWTRFPSPTTANIDTLWISPTGRMWIAVGSSGTIFRR